MTSGSLQSQCMFFEDSRCYFHTDYPTECTLCFNFSTPYKVVDKGKTKAIYTLMDVLISRKDNELVFPKKDGFQKTL
jgi:hypothetical protein